MDIRNQARQRVKECIEQASRVLGQAFDLPLVSFNQRGRIAGSARLQHYEVRLNPVLLEDNPDEFWQEVIPHEICHLLVYRLYGRVRPHGKEWQSMMVNVFNLAPKATHRMDVSKVQGKTFPYRCHCGPVRLSVRRHNKVQRQQQVYACRRCGQQLVAVKN